MSPEYSEYYIVDTHIHETNDVSGQLQPSNSDISSPTAYPSIIFPFSPNEKLSPAAVNFPKLNGHSRRRLKCIDVSHRKANHRV